ncbi:MAG: flavin reductase [Clostridium sp.]|nr:flavin reductase [Clostridium sp.]
MDPKAFFKLSYGVYIVSGSDGGKDGGCVINTMTQVTSSPARLSVALNKNNYTLKLIQASGSFSGVVLSEDVEMDQIKRFGFQCGKDVDKYEGIPMGRDSLNNPYPTEGVCSRFTCRVISTLDVGTHVLIIGEVVEAEVMDEAAQPLTYANYHLKKNGTTPPNAPSYQEKTEKVVGYRCTVCGYILESDTLPDDFICPVCGKDASYFVKL